MANGKRTALVLETFSVLHQLEDGVSRTDVQISAIQEKAKGLLRELEAEGYKAHHSLEMEVVSTCLAYYYW